MTPSWREVFKVFKEFVSGIYKKDGREEMCRVGGNSQKNLKIYIYLRQDRRGGLTEHSG